MTAISAANSQVSEATINTGDLNPILLELGQLVGLFVPAGSGKVSVDTGVFSDPFGADFIGGIPGRAGVIADLLSQMLHAPLADGPDGNIPAASEWFPLMLPAKTASSGDANAGSGGTESKPSGVFVVLPKDHSVTEATFGMGLWHELTPVEGVKITFTLYIPVLHVGTEKISFALANKEGIIASAVVDGPSGQFKGREISVGGLDFAANIFLDGQLPTFSVSLIESQPPIDGTLTTLAELIANSGTAVEYLNAVITSPPITEVLGMTIAGEGGGGLTAGSVLSTLGLLEPVSQSAAYFNDTGPVTYQLVDLECVFGHKSPIEIVEGMLFRSLEVLFKALAGKPIIPISVKGSTGGLYLASEPMGQTSELFGVRLVVADLAITQAPSPEIILQLGKFLSGEETVADGWIAKSGGPALSPGISVFVLDVADVNTDPKPSLAIKVEAVSIGVDVDGAGGKPLLDLKGYTLAGIETRAFFGAGTISGDIEFGAATKVDGLGVPLGPGFNTNSGSNPVASSLVASGDGHGGTAAAGKQDAVNPAFSISAAYVSGGHFVVRLYDAAGAAADEVWIPIQRAYGPLQVEKIGLGWDKPIFNLGFDGGVSLGPLHVELTELTLGLPLPHPADFSKYRLDLQGLGISFNSPPVEITAAFLKISTAQVVGYAGAASVVVGPFGLAALGEYVYAKYTTPPPPPAADGFTSMFIFAVVDAPIGGIPPYFFVTAAAGGFGYNSGVKLPGLNGVTTFPLVAGLDDPASYFGSDDPKAGLAKMGDSIQPRQGQYWLAAGVRFTSFELVQSDVLLVVEFGQDLEIAILGLSKMKLPPAGYAFVSVELGLEVIIQPDQGFFGASAILTDGSYLLAEDCHLTGGFAFYLWFGDNPHSGQFVLTIGGYYSGFVAPMRPSYYPDIPILGFNWMISDLVSIKGGAYFALTPTQVMAGAGLDLLFHAGPIKAWFIAQLDVVIGWAPFHFLAHIGVDIGVSLHIDFLFINFTITLELGCDVTVWGPPTGGTVTVHLWIISFTIGFGEPESAGNPTIDWTEFQSKLLPNPSSTPSGNLFEAPNLSLAATGANAAASDNVVKIVANAGVSAQVKQQDGSTTWIVRPDHFVFCTQSAIPAKTVVATTGSGNNSTYTGPDVSFRPMGLNNVTSTHTVSMVGTVDGVTSVQNLAEDWDHAASTHALPEATWGEGVTPLTVVKPAAIPDMHIGLAEVAPSLPKPYSTGPINILKAFTYFSVARQSLPVNSAATPPSGAEPITSANALTEIQSTLGAPTESARTYLYNALLDLDIYPGVNGPLSLFAANPTGALEALPWLGMPIVGAQTQ